MVQKLLLRLKRLPRVVVKSIRMSVRWIFGHPVRVSITSALVVAGVIIAVFTWSTQLPLTAKLETAEIQHQVDKPIAIELGQAVSGDLTATIYPPAEGEWKLHRNLFGVQKVEFIPKEDALIPHTEYAIKLEDLKRPTGQPLPKLQFNVQTEKAANIADITPADGSRDVAAATEMTVRLERPNRDLRKLRATVEPGAEITALPAEQDDTLYRWQTTKRLDQGREYRFMLFDDKSADPTLPIASAGFFTVAQPQIMNATTNDHFYIGEHIEVGFDIAMKQDAPGLICKCEGDGRWINDKVYQFTPKNIQVAQTYAYTVPEGLQSVAGGVREADAHYDIKTPGHVVAGIRGLGSSAATNAQITVTFDQAVDKASAEARFAMSPAVEGSFRWSNDTTMVFTPQGYDSQTSYRVTLAPGVKPIRFGLDSASTFTMNFTTAAPVVKLNVPVYRQQHKSSCEAAALRMALAYRGIHDSDWNIVQRMGYNGRVKDQANNSWDDPDQMYVGDVNGSQGAFLGYGAHAPPIAKAAQAYGRGASVHYGVSAQFVAEQIHAGNPVIIIGTSSGSKTVYTSWNGPNGVVHAWLGEHARTVIGVTGKASAPISFIVNDPLYGTQETWTPARLIDDINAIPQLASQVVVIK